MKRVIISITVLLALLLCACADKTLDFGDSAQHQTYTAYSLGSQLVDGINIASVEKDIDVLETVEKYDIANAAANKTIKYNGVTYQTEYKESGVTMYNTIVDVYGDSVNKSGLINNTSFWINRKTGEIVSVMFSGNLIASDDYDSKVEYKERSFYVDIAKEAVATLVDVSGYEIRYVAGSSGGQLSCSVYFEKFTSGFLLTYAYVSVLPSGQVVKIQTEKDYNWSRVKLTEINSGLVDNALNSKLEVICESRSIDYIGYKVNYSRIAPDKNGRLGIYYRVSTLDNESDNQAAPGISMAEFFIYIE